MKICGGYFDSDSKKQRILNLEKQMNSPDFWNDQKKSEKIITELKELKKIVNGLVDIRERINNSLEMILLLEQEKDDDLEKTTSADYLKIKEDLEEFKILSLLNGEYDKLNCILEIHPGAGGTESCDWAMMLYRMYLRWCERRGYKYEIMDYQDGDEAGIKSVTINISGEYAYGYLKHEKGVHRLIRLSPFDSNNRRHTSFASVDVVPVLLDDIEYEINEKDLKIDVFRSSGAGGQHVNTTDSAVRITHLPTKIVVTCQNGRSQIQNKEKAMQVLKNKLILLEKQKLNDKINDIRGDQENINFGSQIRSYILHPYSLVKDHISGVETSNVDKVLDGDINIFIKNNIGR